MFLNDPTEFGLGSTLSLSKVIQFSTANGAFAVQHLLLGIRTVLTKKGSCTESTNLHGLQYAQASVDPFQMHLEEQSLHTLHSGTAMHSHPRMANMSLFSA
jgi:hypothetical protein